MRQPALDGPDRQIVASGGAQGERLTEQGVGQLRGGLGRLAVTIVRLGVLPSGEQDVAIADERLSPGDRLGVGRPLGTRSVSGSIKSASRGGTTEG